MCQEIDPFDFFRFGLETFDECMAAGGLRAECLDSLPPAGIPPGALSFLVADEPVLVPDEIYIAYGIFISRGLTVDAKQPVNVFAQIEDGLDELKEIGARIIRHGAEVVRFKDA